MRRALALLALLPLAVAAAETPSGPSAALKGRELIAAGRFDAALPYLERALVEAEAAHGPDSPRTAAALSDLAEANRLAGQIDHAEALYLRTLELDERAKLKDAVATATTLNNLALVYRRQGRHADAERLHNRSLRMIQDALGPNDPRIAMGLHNLATLYAEQGRVTEALPLQERAVAVAERTLGAQNPDTRRFRTALAALGDSLPSAAPGGAPPTPARPGRGAPPPPPSAEASPGPPVAPAPGFVVQVAAVPRADQVADEWRRLRERYPDLRALELQPAQAIDVAGKGTFYRVIAGPLASKAEAEALCVRLRRAGATCRPARS